MDPKLKKDLDGLIEMGYIQRFVENGVTIYGIAPLGDRYVEDVVIKKIKTNFLNFPKIILPKQYFLSHPSGTIFKYN